MGTFEIPYWKILDDNLMMLQVEGCMATEQYKILTLFLQYIFQHLA